MAVWIGTFIADAGSMEKASNDTTKKIDPATKQPCPPDDFKAKPDLDGKNDSGPDPEVHTEKPRT